MSRTYHHTRAETARKRRAMRGACKIIKAAWSDTYMRWNFGGSMRSQRRPSRVVNTRARTVVNEFRAHIRKLDGDEWWDAVTDVRAWMPRRGMR
jgi:hypothetical protein